VEAVPGPFDPFGDMRHRRGFITAQSVHFVEGKGAIGVYGGLNGRDGEPGDSPGAGSKADRLEIVPT
jgi:hypothetical protein